jgi:hypothetical protein
VSGRSYNPRGYGWQIGRDARDYTEVDVGAGRRFLPETQLALPARLSRSELLLYGAAWVLSDEAPLDHLAGWLLFFEQKFNAKGIR